MNFTPEKDARMTVEMLSVNISTVKKQPKLNTVSSLGRENHQQLKV